ncbi:MAG: HDIG domain-containing protein [Clostridiaceae bacterium]|nr:HDIG domain-containing protein [Clostridiaceae bacterium]
MAEKKEKKDKKRFQKIGQVIRNTTFQRILIGIVSLILVFIMISNGAAPRKYKLTLGMASGFDIRAPRDIENTMKTEELALERVKEIPPVIRELEQANTQMLGNIYDFFDTLDNLRARIIPVIEADTGMSVAELLKQENVNTTIPILAKMPEELQNYLLKRDSQSDIKQLKELLIKQIMPKLSSTVITEDNLSEVLEDFIGKIEEKTPSVEMQQVARYILSGVLIPNSMVDELATQERMNDFIEAYKLENPVMIYKNERFIRKEDIITADKLDVLRRLGMLDEQTGPDYLFLVSVFSVLLMLWIILALFLRQFSRKTFESRNELLLIASIIVLTVFLAFMTKEIMPEYSPYITLGFIAPVLIAIFLNIQIAVAVNLVITLSVSLIFRDNLIFIVMFVISGTIASFLSANADQRRKISLSGVIIGAVNILMVACIGIIEKKDWITILYEGGLAFLSGILSVILAIGILPFFEGIFNMITPLKLLELADPNHPLLKRLLMEAPGTYHHSLMVGNLAEVAAREIGGNALLARVGAYFHDVGKLKRPNFFKENQMSENPHDRITPNLSTLVITSHTKDGEQLALKYKLPRAIRDIIVQHHGTTLVAYFYHKAKQGEKGVEVKESNFRYEGPKPQSKEAAVVLLADSVEAAVRSLPDKTKGKIEGLIRKIIKDKLDDGQLDNCDLTLNDMNEIANAFMTVLSGFFHERTEYPELEKKTRLSELDKYYAAADENGDKESENRNENENGNSKQTE